MSPRAAACRSSAAERRIPPGGPRWVEARFGWTIRAGPGNEGSLSSRRDGPRLIDCRVTGRLLRDAALVGAVLGLAIQPARASDPAPTAVAEPAPTVVVIGDRTTTVAVQVEPTPRAPWPYPERGLLVYPEGPGEGKDRWAVGGVWQIAPMFKADYRRGLGAGFSLDARLQTIVLYNQLGAGAQWAARVGPFSLGVMAHVDAFFGVLGKAFVATTQFDATGWGILLDPGVKAGLQVAQDAWLTLQVEAYLSLYQASNLGGLVISPKSALYEGLGATLVVEHAVGKGVVYYGASLYQTRANYPLWFNVDFSPRMIGYLGVQAGYEF